MTTCEPIDARPAMKNILAKTNRRVLEQFARSRVLLGFDFDGTLAPIVHSPDGARLRARTRQLFRLVAERYPCVVISGRARLDVLARLDGIPVAGVVGNHGLEPQTHVRHVRRLSTRVRPWPSLLQERLRGVQGVVIEDKGLSVAVHYRRSRERRLAKRAILDAVAALGPQVRVVAGKLAIDVLPDVAASKGLALRRLRARVADTAVYVGDDATDEDVFALNEPGRLLSIRVGRHAASAARYYLRRQAEVDDFLQVLLELRGGLS